MIVFRAGKTEDDSQKSRSAPPPPPPSAQLPHHHHHHNHHQPQVMGDCHSGSVTSYLVASSPEVLTQILRDNESRGLEFNPALYTVPASAHNTAKVDFAPGPPPPSPAPSGRHHRPPAASSSGRSLPGSAHSTLSRGGHSASSPGSLEMSSGSRRSVRRKTSLAGCQVTQRTVVVVASYYAFHSCCMCGMLLYSRIFSPGWIFSRVFQSQPRRLRFFSSKASCFTFSFFIRWWWRWRVWRRDAMVAFYRIIKTNPRT